MRKARLIFILGSLACFSIILSAQLLAQTEPSFVIFTYGFWGSMDRLPQRDPAWLAASPYPHYLKHQETAFLAGPDYRPIPQKYLATGEGPSVFRYFLCSYYLLEQEMRYWAQRLNRESGREEVKICDDWQTDLQGQQRGRVNIIYLKYDWRLDLPQIDRDYVAPLVDFIRQHWPNATIHFVGHSLGGLVGRYAVSRHPHCFDSLISIGGPQYGIYEIGMECRGERTTFNGNLELEKSQELGLRMAESFFFQTDVFQKYHVFPEAARLFIQRYLPVMRWLDPEAGLLQDGFGDLPKLKEATRHAIAIYGLGFGSYDLQGIYHPEVPDGWGVGPGLTPGGNDAPPGYGITGDGRIDPVSARGPFEVSLCLGKDQPHGALMWSPLVLTMLIDRFFYGGTMPGRDIWWELRRLQVPNIAKKSSLGWMQQARLAWELGNRS